MVGDYQHCFCSIRSLIVLQGKTVLSSTIIEDLSGGQNQATIYLYFHFNDKEKQLYGNMLRSLVAQLAYGSSVISPSLITLFSSCQLGNSQPLNKALETMLREMADQHQRSFIILDALDECGERHLLINFLERMIK